MALEIILIIFYSIYFISLYVSCKSAVEIDE